MLTKDQLIREHRARSATWPALALVYGAIVGAMVVSAMAMIS